MGTPAAFMVRPCALLCLCTYGAGCWAGRDKLLVQAVHAAPRKLMALGVAFAYIQAFVVLAS